jgi:DNA-binding beta-propeller fold protein YncE
LALDQHRGIIYVGNVNDGTVLAVDMQTMRPIRRIPAVPRVFGIALSGAGNTLFAVANQSAGSQFQAAGFVAAIDLRGSRSRIVARSRNLRFPLGVAYDPQRDRVFVTDEERNLVYVLDARTLRDAAPPLPTCNTPWKPYYDAPSQRLFIPCARANKIDVFDARSLRRVRNAPFATGGYPLAVSVWRAPRVRAR